MANTRRIDREIATAENRLEGIRNQQQSSLRAGDQAKMAGLVGVGIAKAVRGRTAPAAERAAGRIWDRAEQEAAADLRVLQSERQQQLTDQAAARREKKKGGWF
ncbi:hypothetical protein OHA69_41510 [Streptomyces anulatus]|uniref:hypothetical protein n=1 Tax=Streptomyces anulatus TaxID=1892 RepID=UPI00224E93CE|nr:hypothetical protein [Streptomyces anulatus]MCX4524071.1 hypothetical protein [Streptomyces anulatus]